MAWAALAQGQFNFANRVILSGIDARLYEPDGVTPLSGTNWWAQPYVGKTLDSLVPVGTPIYFRTGASAGYILPTIYTTPYSTGTRVWVEMRVWHAKWTSYEAAVASGGCFGKSDPIQLYVTEAPGAPPDMVGLKSFPLACVPEPSPQALGLLIAAALMLRHRR